MRPDEFQQIRLSGYSDKQLRNFVKVVRSTRFLTSDRVTAPNEITLNLPAEARYFLGVRIQTGTKAQYELDLKINDELVWDQVNATLLGLLKSAGAVKDLEYIDAGRRLNGNDQVVYKFITGATIVEVITWFYVVDKTAAPREGR